MGLVINHTRTPDPRLVKRIVNQVVEAEDAVLKLRAEYEALFANHEAPSALHFMRYNFCRIHKTLRVLPAMEAGIAGHV